MRAFKLISVAAMALSLGTAVSPALARAIPEPAAAAGKKADDLGDPAAASRKYCVESYVTGSRLPHRECRTRADWIASEGFDPATAPQVRGRR